MSPKMRTRSAGRPAAESLGGGTGERVGRGGRGRRPREGNDERVDELNGQGNDQGLGANGVRGSQWECKREPMGCTPTSSTIIAQQMQPLPACWLSHEMQNLKSVSCGNYAIVGAGLSAYTDRIRVGELLVHSTDEDFSERSIKKIEKKGNVGEPSKDRSGRDDNKRTRTVNAFATTVNPVGRENTGTWPKCTTCNSYHELGGPCLTCFNCNRPGHLARDCRGVPRNVNLINARNPTVRACYEYGSTDHVRPACPRLNRARGSEENWAFMLGAEEARQDPNIMTGTFTLNNHFATTLFDSGADYNFVFTTFIPLLGLEPTELGFKYEIEIASGQLVEIDKVIKGCKLEIEGHVFDIDLIPFGYGSFDVIIGMDWLSN
ncbi:putative reverse transcriptase domain-containing protein [Tanacetum coccineum]